MDKDQIIIKSKEMYGDVIRDSNTRQIVQRSPRGFVEIYSRGEDGLIKEVSKSNLIILQGRELIGQLLTNVLNNNAISKNGEHIYWLGLGVGGANPATPFSPIPPTELDTDLYDEVPISSDDSTNCTDLTTLLNGRTGYFKHKIDQVEFEVDGANNNAYLITKLTTTIGISDAIGTPEWAISEAGLFTSLDNITGQNRGYNGGYHLFARITFPSVIKTSTRELIFLWYLYT